jgi:hypothetical protein
VTGASACSNAASSSSRPTKLVSREMLTAGWLIRWLSTTPSCR